MGGGNSRPASKNPGKSVVAFDTNIDDFDENWSENQNNNEKTNGANGHIKTANDQSKNNETKQTNGHVKENNTKNSGHIKNDIVILSKNTSSNGIQRSNRKHSANQQNVMNMVDLEEYD